jgi:hypothetical protein
MLVLFLVLLLSLTMKLAKNEKLTSEIKVTRDCVQFCARAITMRYVVCPPLEGIRSRKEIRIKTVNMKRKIIRFMLMNCRFSYRSLILMKSSLSSLSS